MSVHLITYLTRIQFGAGARRLLRDELDLAGVTRPMIVTDEGVVAAGLIGQMEAAGLGPVPVFDACPENPTEEAAQAGLGFLREHGCDGIVGIGGGSPIDLAKAVSLLATHPGPLEQYAAINGGTPRITEAKPPVFAVPTTAGTGSEVGRAALISLGDGRKLGIISPHMIPRAAVCDPELTIGLPARLTAATGMDAVTHCIETFLSPRFNPPADAIALDGLSRAFRSIVEATRNGSSLEARTEMMMAALQGGMTFQKGLGAVHGLSHPLGGLQALRLHHGTLNAVLLPAVLRFNAPAIGPRLLALRRAMGLGEEADLADAILGLNRELGLPVRLSEMGVREEHLAGIGEAAARDHSTATNPRPIGAAEYDRLLRESL